MARVDPFPALRPRPELAAKICELPYDVMSSDEAREMAKDNPLSFLHVSKPEIDLDPKIQPDDDQVYAKGRENLQKLIRDGAMFQEEIPHFYLYRQVMGSHQQTGIVAVASCEDYVKNVIKKHELTRPDKEEDRVRHIETLRSQTGPVFLAYRSRPEIDLFVESRMMDEPIVDFTRSDGVRHTAWSIHRPADLQTIQQAFEKIPHLYVADGHHRSAAAVRVWKSGRIKDPAAGSFLAVIFSSKQMQILPYNRVVKDLNGLDPQKFADQLRTLGSLTSKPQPKPFQQHEISLFFDGAWHVFHWKKDLIAKEDATGRLDVSLLQKHVLSPLLGIGDPRTSTRIQFIGGIRGTKALEEKVRSGGWAVAFSMFPTQIEDLMTIADQGGLMPPKSTWFEPKLRDAMFCHMLDS